MTGVNATVVPKVRARHGLGGCMLQDGACLRQGTAPTYAPFLPSPDVATPPELSAA